MCASHNAVGTRLEHTGPSRQLTHHRASTKEAPLLIETPTERSKRIE